MIRVVFALLAAALLGSGCTLLWIFNNDPQGLPCDFEADEQGACLEGYTCIISDDVATCVKAGELKEGEVCARTEQCEGGLACHSAFEVCDANDDDINCDLIPKDEIKKRCHTKCDPADPDICRKEERCYTVEGISGVKGVCQTGTCASDNDCTTADDEGAFCATFTVNEKNGLCLEECDMLSCRTGGVCLGCDGRDNDEDGFNCEPLADGLHTTAPAPICFDVGTVPFFGACNGFMGECVLGSFCTATAVGQPFYCAPYCSTNGGNPQCENGATCLPLLGNTGFCPPG